MYGLFRTIRMNFRIMAAKVSSPLWDPSPFKKYSPETLLDELKKIQAKPVCYSGKLRIVICACGKDGKSSSINNILAALSNEYGVIANTGGADCHVTQQYNEYEMYTDDSNDSPFVICDTPGLKGYQPELETEVIKAAIRGKFTSGDEIIYDQLKLEDVKQMPEKQGMAVCVIFVIDSTSVTTGKLKESKAFSSMKSVLAFVQWHGIKTACLLTKCDQLDSDVKEDMRNIYYSKSVEDARVRVTKDFSGFPGERIFPIVNYTDVLKTSPNMRIQSLFALLHIMGDILSSMRRKVKIPLNNH